MAENVNICLSSLTNHWFSYEQQLSRTLLEHFVFMLQISGFFSVFFSLSLFFLLLLVVFVDCSGFKSCLCMSKAISSAIILDYWHTVLVLFQKRFVRGLKQHGKNFYLIRKTLLPCRETVSDLLPCSICSSTESVLVVLAVAAFYHLPFLLISATLQTFHYTVYLVILTSVKKEKEKRSEYVQIMHLIMSLHAKPHM